jgi:hypothetical protein
MSRPELTGHASLFYNERESKKYDSSSRMVSIQREITCRAIELLKLDNSDGGNGRPSLILDVGCGSGLSGQVRTYRSAIIFIFGVDGLFLWCVRNNEKVTHATTTKRHAIYFWRMKKIQQPFTARTEVC